MRVFWETVAMKLAFESHSLLKEDLVSKYHLPDIFTYYGRREKLQ